MRSTNEDPTLANQAGERIPQGELAPDVLSRMEATSAGISYIGIVAAVFLVFGALASLSGGALGFVLAAAAIGFAFHINTVAEFNKDMPSAGFYNTYIGRTFGNHVGALFAFIYSAGLVAIVGVVTMGVGLWVSNALASLTIVNYSHLPWWIPAVLAELLVVALLLRGVKFSVRVSATLVVFEVAVLVIGGIAMVIHNPSAVVHSGNTFNPTLIPNGVSGFGLAFTLAIFLFLGTSSSAPLAEEAKNPKKTIPFAVFAAAGIATVLYIFAAWAEQVGFRNNTTFLAKQTFPYITGVANAFHPLVYLMYLAGLTSALAVVIASSNAISRVWYSMGRDGLFPKAMGSVDPRTRVPRFSILVSAGVASALFLVFGGIAGGGFSVATGYAAYAELATVGTDFVILVFMVTNVALIVHELRNHAGEVRWARRIVAPVIGAIIFVYPFWESVKPTQPRPYNWFGAVLVGFLIVGSIYARIVVRRGAVLGSQAGLER